MRIAILGYGNIGRAAEQAIKAAPDMELAGIYHHNDCLDCIDADAVLICTPTREVQKFATVLAARGICTVDSFDIHTSILDYRTELMPVCKSNHAVSVISAGWDPGSDSIVRVLMQSVIETANLEQEVAAAITKYSPSRLIEGNGTTSKDARTRIERAVPSLAITVIDEYRTTEQAKKEYWKAHPPKGLRRFLPTTMQVPPVPVDDFVAVILATRYLEGSS